MMQKWFTRFCPFLFGALFSALFCAIVSAAPLSENEAILVGYWYGEFAPTPQSPIQRFLTERRADGTYTLSSRLYIAGKPQAQLVNSGLWGISNGLFFTVTTMIDNEKTDPKKTDNINPYLVISLEKNKFVYLHIPSGNKFQVQRVDASFRLPN